MKVISIDVGTSYIKAAFIELNEEEKTAIIREVVNAKQVSISNGPVHEHPPQYILSETERLIKHLVSTIGIPDALVFSTYLFSTVLMTENGEFKSNVITWLDRRSEKALRNIASFADEVYRRTGCPPLYIYSLPKILYLQHVNPDVLEKSLILDAKSMVMYYFTGEAVTDYSTASGTYQMLDIWNLKWDNYVLSIAGVDEKRLPRIEEGDYLTWIKPSIAGRTGLPEKTPIVLGFYDGGSMIFGLSAGLKNVGVVNMGTSSMLRVTSQNPILDATGSMSIQSYYLYKRTWVPGLGLNNCGIVVEYLSSAIGLKLEDFINAAKLTDVEYYSQASTPLVIPLLYPERHPKLSRDVGVWIVGMKEGLTPQLLACSVLEGLVLLLKFVDEVLAESGASYEYVVAGGKLTQIPIGVSLLASALGKQVKVSEIPDAIHIGNLAISGVALKAVDLDGVRSLANRFTRTTVHPHRGLANKLEKDYGVFKRLLNLATLTIDYSCAYVG